MLIEENKVNPDQTHPEAQNEEESPNGEGEKKENPQKSEEEKEKEDQLKKHQDIKIIPESHIISMLTQNNHTLQNVSKVSDFFIKN